MDALASVTLSNLAESQKCPHFAFVYGTVLTKMNYRSDEPKNPLKNEKIGIR